MRTLLRAVITLAVLVALAFGADVFTRHQIISRIADPVEEQFGARPEVSVAGSLVLPQVIGGSLDRVDGHLSELTYDGVTFHDVRATARGVDVRAPRTADHLAVSAGIALDELNRLYSSMSPIGSLLTANDQIVVEVDVFGAVLHVAFTTEVTPEAIILNPSAFLADGERFDISVLSDLIGVVDQIFTIPIDLPEGLELTGVEVDSEGVRATIEGSDVAIEELAESVG